MRDRPTRSPQTPPEMVPNYWLRSLLASPHLTREQLAAALDAAGLPPGVLDVPGTLLPLSAEIAVFDALAARSADPLLAIRLGQTNRTQTGSILTYIAFSSPTIGHALEQLAGFSRLTRPRSRVSLVTAQDGLELRLEHPAPDVRFAVAHVEFVVAAILHTLVDFSGITRVARRVVLATPTGVRHARIEAALGCPVEPGAGRTGIVFAPATLALPLRTRDADLQDHLTEYGRILLSQRPQDEWTLADHVFRLVVCRLTGGPPRLGAVARDLALSERTLARRLAGEGTSFRGVVDAAREAMARALMDDPSLSLTEISYLLGFADQGSFTHAFRRWTGHPPAHARRAPHPPARVSADGGSRQAGGG